MISAEGQALRTKVKSISKSGRATQGVTLINLHENDSVVSVARIAHADLERVGVK